MSTIVMSSVPVLDLSRVAHVEVSFIMKARQFVPAWSTEMPSPPMPSELAGAFMQDFQGYVDARGLFGWLRERFAVESGAHKFNDRSINSNGHYHRLRCQFVAKETDGAYPVEDLRPLYKDPWTIVGLRADSERERLYVYCSGLLPNQRPDTKLKVEEEKLRADQIQHTKPPWWTSVNQRKKAKRLAQPTASPS